MYDETEKIRCSDAIQGFLQERLPMSFSDVLILNVDDNDGARYAKTRILQRAGFQVAEAENGADALAFVAETPPDLVLLDVKLPDINGIEVCRRIKANASSAMVLVLQTSAALTGAADKIRGLEGGADNYLAAPIESDELIANVTALLRLRRTQVELQESEERFRQMAENINDVFWIFSLPDHALLYVSNAYEMLWQQSVQTLHGHPKDWMKSVHAEDLERVQAAFDALLENRPYDEEYRLVQPNGSLTWVRDRGFPVKNAAGETYRIARITSDISEAKNAERLLKEADQHKDEFLATLAHELRNPLGPIRNAVALLQHAEPATTTTQARARDIISRQVDHLARLVDDLLDVARISKGKIALQKSPLAAESFITAALETVGPFINARHHTLDVFMPDESIWVMGDSVRLAQGVSNLLHNAAKYTASGGKISLRLERTQQNTLKIIVQDNGIGIASERIADMFTLFSQGDTAPDRAQDGLGIGLSLVKRLVELHDGKIDVQSPGKGKGSTFSIELPTINTPSATEAPETTDAVNDAEKKESQSGGLKILVVDDNVDSGEMMAALLEELGHEVKCAQNAASAMTIAEAFFPSVMLLDIGLPETDGYELARMIRKKPTLANVKLIAVTGYGAERDRINAMEAGFDHHLIKPANLKLLTALLEAVKN